MVKLLQHEALCKCLLPPHCGLEVQDTAGAFAGEEAEPEDLGSWLITESE